MTLVYQRATTGPGVHALVLGVGAYPYAKPQHATSATPSNLVDVQDLPSAAAGAALFVDWLISHADHLPAPLASVELLISDPSLTAGAGGHYAWTGRSEFAAAMAAGGADPRGDDRVAPCTETAVQVAGLAWAARLGAGHAPSVAVVYGCGHGIAMPSRSLLLLEDLAGLSSVNARSAWEPFLDVQLLASRLERVKAVEKAYIFVDACQETLTERLVAEADPTTRAGEGVRLLAPDHMHNREPSVLLLLPGPKGSLTFDDGKGTGGRYTHVLLQALRGAAARQQSGQADWVIFSNELNRAMTQLYRLEWTDVEFWPTPSLQPVADRALVRFPHNQPPRIPVRVRLDPAIAAREPGANVHILDPQGHTIAPWNAPGDIWLEWIEARRGLCSIRSTFAPGSRFQDGNLQVDLSSMCVDPILVHRVVR